MQFYKRKGHSLQLTSMALGYTAMTSLSMLSAPAVKTRGNPRTYGSYQIQGRSRLYSLIAGRFDFHRDNRNKKECLFKTRKFIIVPPYCEQYQKRFTLLNRHTLCSLVDNLSNHIRSFIRPELML